MLRKLLLVAVLAAAALPAGAQPRRDQSDGPRHHRLFLSPSGEPFRGRGGLDAWFAQADADHDGSISAAEFRADAARAFALYDSDGDGVIDGLEVQAYERDRAPEITEFGFGGPGDGGGRRGRRGHGRGHGGDPGGSAEDAFFGVGPDGAARFSLLNEPEPLLAADADADGKVTRAEWDRRTERRFAELDRAKTGKLTLEALRARGRKR